MAARLPLTLLALFCLPAAVGVPSAHLSALSSGLGPAAGSADGPFALLVATAGLLAWAVALWLAAVALAVALQLAPGGIGHAARASQRWLAPSVLTRAVAVVLGVTLLTAPSPAGAADSQGAGTPAASVSLDWPAAETVPPPDVAAERVVVRPGDSLWRIAEQRLGAGASDREVAGAWPAWWSANRDAIGPDPDLLRPGTRLVPPA